MTLTVDVQQGWHDSIVELFDIDLSPITGNTADVYYFTNQTKEDGSAIQWQGRTYSPLPIISAGYEKSTTGQIAQPSLTVANILGTFSELISDYDDLVGAKVTRHRTLAKYLDGEPGADPLQEFPVDIYYIERKTEETALTITWDLASVLDLEGLKLPRRIITQNLCLWKYRSSECGYTGAPLFDERDQILSPSGQSAEGAALINAYRAMEQRYAEREIAQRNRNKALEEKDRACSLFTFLNSVYDPSSGTFVEGPIAYVNGVALALGSILRAGVQRAIVNGQRRYEVETWGESASGCTNATNALNAAEAALAAAEAAYASAVSAYTAALAALPADDPIWQSDVCGKRTGSCKLRFPRQALPYGGFPGASIQQ
jgi:lambda family phage minor tail protein L